MRKLNDIIIDDVLDRLSEVTCENTHSNEDKSKKCFFISLEHISFEIALRLLSIQTGTDYEKLLSRELTNDEWANIMHATSELNDLRLYIEDQVPITVPEIEQKAKELKGVDCIIIDNFYLLSAESKKNRDNELNEIVQKLKSMAEELNIPVVCTECIRKNYHKPSLTDVRGNLAQTFDMVMFLYREDWDYDWADREYFTTDSNITKLIIAKNRYGDTGTIELKYDKKAKCFTEVKTI